MADKPVVCEGDMLKPYRLYWIVDGKQHEFVKDYDTEAEALADKPKRLDRTYGIWHEGKKLP